MAKVLIEWEEDQVISILAQPSSSKPFRASIVPSILNTTTIDIDTRFIIVPHEFL